MSLQDNLAIEPWGWNEIPQDLLTTIFIEAKPSARCNMSCVSKVWHDFLNRKEFGKPFLEELSIGVESSDGWIHTYREFYLTPDRVYAADFSGSTRQCKQKMCALIDKLALCHFNSIQICGLDCIVFAELVYTQRFYNLEGIHEFFSTDYHDIESEVDLGLGTSLNHLFNYLIKLREVHQKIKPNSHLEVTIFSDYEDSEIRLSKLTDKNPNMNIQCINVGGRTGQTYLNQMMETYDDYLKKMEVRLRKSAENYLRIQGIKKDSSSTEETEKFSSSEEEGEIEVKSQKNDVQEKRGTKRKIEEDDDAQENRGSKSGKNNEYHFSMDVPLNIEIVDENSWVPAPKRRKLTYTTS